MNYDDLLDIMFFKFKENQKLKEDHFPTQADFGGKDKLGNTLLNLKSIYKKGKIAYGTIVMANHQLFEGTSLKQLPAVMLYSRDTHFALKPYELREIVESVHRACKKDDDKYLNLKKIYKNEYNRVQNVKLPKSLTGGREVFWTAVFVCPEHLPGNKIRTSVFPILYLDKDFGTVILPKKYWDQEIIDDYLNK